MDYPALLSDSRPIFSPPAPDVRCYRNMMIPMPDGVTLAADVYLPSAAPEAGKLPVVLEYIPYRKDQADVNQRPFYLRLPRLGYLFARVDIRGTGASAGASTDEYTQQEQQDGYNTVEWLAAQDWCDGQVNMLGISYGGFTALQVAALAPPHLKSIIPVMFTDDRYVDECHYRGGLKRLYYNLSYYGGQMIAWNALPPVVDDTGPSFGSIWQTHLEENEPYILKWYKHQTDGEYWHSGSVGHFPEKIRCPVFMIGGWRDGYMNCNLRLFEKLTTPKKVLIGPWNHAMPDMAVPGPCLDYMHEVGRWLDHWCRNQDTGIMAEPPVTVFMQKSEPPDPGRVISKGSFRAETTWPAPGYKTVEYYLEPNQRLRRQSGKPKFKNERVNELTYDPTVGTCGGLFSGGLPFGLPCDQRPDEALSLTYTSAPLKRSFYLLGRPKLCLFVSTSAPVIGFSATLSDVTPDGRSHLICKGILNITRRNSLTHPEPALPETIYELEIELDATGWVFQPGQRIRLAIANADWPNLWPTPYPAVSRIYFGQDRPSRLILPAVPSRGSGKVPVFKPPNVDKQPLQTAVDPPVWRVSRDMLTGRTTVDITSKGQWRVSPLSVFKRESTGRFTVDPDDPGHASGHGRHKSLLASPNMEIVSESDVMIQATPTAFQIVVALTVSVNDARIFSKKWIESIPRNLL
ncbi:MAG: CocE/NonD family hydrolase [Desulfobacterales bacterium]|jgi:putative CocE/NonD family hydrolase